MSILTIACHPFDQTDADVPVLYVGLGQKRIHGGDHVLVCASADHVDLMGGRRENIGDVPKHGAGVRVPDLQPHEIGQKVSPIRKLHAGAVDGNSFSFEAHGGGDVIHALQTGKDISLVGLGAEDLDGASVQVQKIEAAKEFG